MRSVPHLSVSDSSGVKPEANLDDQFTPGRLALLLGILILIAYPEIVLGSHAFFYRDAGLFGYPLAYYFRDCFWHGEIPLWNPYNNCGIPFLAQWNTLVLYPPSLFYVLLPLPWSLNIFLLGHLFLAGLGMYFLAYRWFGNRFAASVAGVAFAWNGLSLHCLMWPGNLATLAWMPWVVLLLEGAWNRGGRQLIWASLAGAMQMLTGSPEIILFTWAIACAVLLLEILRKKLLFWPVCRRMLLAVALVTGLAAAQLLPFGDLLAHGQRSSSYSNYAWSMPAWGWANFLVPLFRCTPSVTGVFSQDEQQWTSSYYAGIAIFALALIALLKIRQARTTLLSLMAIAGILCALGDTGFIWPALKQSVPVLGFVRYPIKFVVVAIFCFPLLAAAAIIWLKSREIVLVRRTLVEIPIVLCAGVLLVLGTAYYFPFPSDSWSDTWWSGLSRLLFLAAIFAGILYQRQIQKAASQLILSFGILLLFALDISTHTPRQNPTVITRAYESLRPQMSELPRLGQARAMISREVQTRMEKTSHPYPLNHYLGQRGLLLGDCNLFERIPKINGFFTLYLREEWEVESSLYQANLLPNLADFLGVSQITSSTHLFLWDARTNFMPLATVGQEPIFAGPTNTLKALASPQFDPRQKVYLPREARSSISATKDAEAKILSARFTAHELVFQTDAKTPAMLVVAQTHYHLWKAYLDARPTTLWRANHGFQAVEIPAGQHQVRLVYEDRNFYFGAIASAVSLLLCVVALVLRRNQRN